jgi:ribosomal protein S18 acetylase RimI-like enzyme
LYALYLLKSHQKKGIGRALFIKGQELLLADGYKRFVLTVLANNPTVGFYERMGGIKGAKATLEIGENTLDEWIYGFPLG